MPKPNLRGRKPANRELQPELYLNRPRARGVRPSYDEMREALIATRGRYGLASIRLQCAERSLRDWVRQDQSLVDLVDELRTLRIDKFEARIDQIADDPAHPRSFDANRLIVERLGRHRGWGAYLEVAGPVHALTRDQFDEIQELKKRAKVLILNEDQPATELKPLPPPSDRSPQVPDEIDGREEDEDDENEDANGV